jgi:hypothetical protein
VVAPRVLVVPGSARGNRHLGARGGFAYERGPHGFTNHWGRVLTCEIPQRIVCTWPIAPDRTPEPDPDRASEVEVVFTGSADDGTEVALEHRGWERHGEARASTATAR